MFTLTLLTSHGPLNVKYNFIFTMFGLMKLVLLRSLLLIVVNLRCQIYAYYAFASLRLFFAVQTQVQSVNIVFEQYFSSFSVDYS